MDEVDLAASGGLEVATQQLAAVERDMQQVEAHIERLLARQAALQGERERLRRTMAVEQRAPRADWQGGFPWDTRVQQLLGGVFGLNSWRPLQREVINATLQGRDVLCLMPSGGGKSLNYQLPALLGGSGLTLVVSPLLSLIQDQVLGLAALGVKAAALTSLTPKEDVAAIGRDVEDTGAGLRLLYCTPEKIVNSKRFFAKLEKVYKAGRLDRIAIDEAHCCSQWGNDFRPDYKKLGILKQQFPDTPIIALTATATQAVCDDLRSILKIDGCELFKMSVNRPNLYYEVKQKPGSGKELVADIARWIGGNYPDGESGIVYVLTRKDAESLAEELRAAGISCQPYHADIEPARRASVHTQWSQGKLQVIVATIAFGMGINNPSVRFVIHHTISKSVENYYQESGRAGRDGLPAHCRLYYRFADYMRQATVVTMESNWELHLRGMLQYAAAPTCRRSLLCRHFGEAPPPCHAMCNHCKQAATAAAKPAVAPAVAAVAGAGEAAGDAAAAAGRKGGKRQVAAPATAAAAAATGRKDVTEAAKGAVQTLQAWPGDDQRATMIQLIDKWRASKDPAASKAAKALSRDENEAVLQQLVLEGLVRLDFGFTAYATNAYLKSTGRAGSLLQGRKDIFIAAVPQAGGASGADAAVKPEPGAAAQLQQQHRQQLAQRGQQQQSGGQQQQQGGRLPPDVAPAAAAAAAGAGAGSSAGSAKAAAAAAAQHRAAAAAAASASACSVLEAARQQLAAASDTIPAAVLSDDQVRQLAAQRPATQQQLAAVIGGQKAKLYGPQLLAALLGQAASPQQQQQQQRQQGPAPPAAGRCGTQAVEQPGQQQAKQQRQPKQQSHTQPRFQPKSEPPQTQQPQTQQQRPPKREQPQQQRQPPKRQQQLEQQDVVVLDGSSSGSSGGSDDDDDFERPPPAAKRGKRV